MFDTKLTGDISIEEAFIGLVKSNRYAVLHVGYNYTVSYRIFGLGGGDYFVYQDSSIPPPDFIY